MCFLIPDFICISSKLIHKEKVRNPSEIPLYSKKIIAAITSIFMSADMHILSDNWQKLGPTGFC